MKQVLIVHHSPMVTKEQLAAFINEVPESMKSESEIHYKPFNDMPQGLITVTPKSMKEIGLDLIGKSKR